MTCENCHDSGRVAHRYGETYCNCELGRELFKKYGNKPSYAETMGYIGTDW